MKSFYVMIPVTEATVTFRVSAESEDEAKEMALEEYRNCGAKYALGIDTGTEDPTHVLVEED